jgi:hypothetical protein
MTKKSDRAAGKWFKGAGKTTSNGIVSTAHFGADVVNAPFEALSGTVSDVFGSGTGTYILIGGAVLIIGAVVYSATKPINYGPRY